MFYDMQAIGNHKIKYFAIRKYKPMVSLDT